MVKSICGVILDGDNNIWTVGILLHHNTNNVHVIVLEQVQEEQVPIQWVI
jgi:hypothetical protein